MSTKFEPGRSGNPKGRPKGASKSERLRALLQPHAKDLVQKAVELALAGDQQALRLCLERLLPPLKAQAPTVEISALKEAKGLVHMGEAIIQAVAAGKIAPDTANTLLAALSAHSHIIEVEDLQRRIEALEGGAGGEK